MSDTQRDTPMTPPDTSASMRVQVTQEDGDHVFRLRVKGELVAFVFQDGPPDSTRVWRAKWMVPPERLPNQTVLDVCTVAGMLVLQSRRAF